MPPPWWEADFVKRCAPYFVILNSLHARASSAIICTQKTKKHASRAKKEKCGRRDLNSRLRARSGPVLTVPRTVIHYRPVQVPFPENKKRKMRKTGLEPVWNAPHAPQTCASASSATSACRPPLPGLSTVHIITHPGRFVKGISRFFRKFAFSRKHPKSPAYPVRRASRLCPATGSSRCR